MTHWRKRASGRAKSGRRWRRRCRAFRVGSYGYDKDTGELELYPHFYEYRLDGWVGIKMSADSAALLIEKLKIGMTIRVSGALWKHCKQWPGPNAWSTWT